MDYIGNGFAEALRIILTADSEFMAIVGVSLLVALTVTPMLCSRFLRLERSHGRTWHAFEHSYRGLEAGYKRLIGWGLRWRGAVVALALAAVVGGVSLAGIIPVDLMVPDDRSEQGRMPL